jgi:hypothetical protein
VAETYLAAYLNDHLAGSEVALELLEHLEGAHAGTPLARFVAGLRAEIAADRSELEAVMARRHVAQSRPRKAAAWLSEKLTELKLRLDDPPGGALRRLEVLEAVSVGIEGKRLLWRSLGAAAEGRPDLGGTDFAHLERRAEEQRQSLEAFRLEAARAALGSASAEDFDGSDPEATTID